jgi:hypothetical protein
VLVLPRHGACLADEVDSRGSHRDGADRFGMSLAVGVTILAGCSPRQDPGRRDDRSSAHNHRRGCVFVGHFFAYAQSFRRNTVGYDGRIAFFVHPRWLPAVPAVLLTVGYVAVLAVLTAWLFWMAPVRVHSAPDAPAAGEGNKSVGPSESPA